MLKNGFYNVASAVISTGLTLLTIPLIIRLMGVEEYGLWTLVSTVLGIMALAEAGLSISTTVFLSRDLANDDADGISQTLTVTVGLMLLLASLTAISLWMGAGVIINFFPKLGQAQREVAVQSLQLGSLVIWTRLLQQILVGVEQAYQQYGVMNFLNTLQIGLSNLGMLTVAWLGGRTLELMTWQAVTSVAGLIAHAYAGWLLIRTANPHLVWDSAKGLALARYSLMTWFTALGRALFGQGDRLVVGALLGTEVLGVYAAITSVTGQINSFSALPIQPLLPKLSNLLEKQDIERATLHQQIQHSVQINGLIALWLGGMLFTFAPLIVNVILPEAASKEYVLAFRFAATIYAHYSINAVGYYVLLAIKEVKVCMTIVLFSGGLSLTLIAVGSKYLNLLGAVLGNSGYLVTLLLFVVGLRKLDIPVFKGIEWLHFPLLFFWMLVIVNFGIHEHFNLKVAIFIIQSIVILIWFQEAQEFNIKAVFKSISRK